MSHKTLDTRRADDWPTRRRKARKRSHKRSQDRKPDPKGGRDR